MRLSARLARTDKTLLNNIRNGQGEMKRAKRKWLWIDRMLLSIVGWVNFCVQGVGQGLAENSY